MYQEQIPWIKGTPMGLKVRKIDFVPPHLHENTIEIILCLKGTVKFDYEYEKFTLREGEFICVDKDAHYLYDGNNNICVSFYIDLNWFTRKYTYITSMLFVCEYTSDSITPKRECHDQLKGILISLLSFLRNSDNRDEKFYSVITACAEKIVMLFLKDFDIIFFYNPHLKLKPDLFQRYREMMMYMQERSREKITLEDMSNEFHLTKSYISEFFRATSIGFSKCLGYHRAYKSERLLLLTDMKITEISETCGFSTPKYYYSVFKEWYRCTPRQFRNNYTEKMSHPCLEEEVEIEAAFDFIDNIMLDHYLNLFLYK